MLKRWNFPFWRIFRQYWETTRVNKSQFVTRHEKIAWLKITFCDFSKCFIARKALAKGTKKMKGRKECFEVIFGPFFFAQNEHFNFQWHWRQINTMIITLVCLKFVWLLEIEDLFFILYIQRPPRTGFRQSVGPSTSIHFGGNYHGPSSEIRPRILDRIFSA